MNNTSRTSVRTLVMLALLVAMSIVFSRVLSISTGFVRFNLGSLPVLLAAVALLSGGPRTLNELEDKGISRAVLDNLCTKGVLELSLIHI